MSHDAKKYCKIRRKTDENLVNFDLLIGSFRAKYITFDLKDYTGVILQDTEEWEEIWRKTNLWFEKWHEKCGKVLSEHLKVSKLGLWWDPFLVENA